jgi:hypothetical protein
MVMAFRSLLITMKTQSIPCFLLLALFSLAVCSPSFSQTLLKRTTFKNDKFDFGVGGTLSVIGAPHGSISIEGWQRPEIEISAEIEVQAPTEAELAKLTEITGFTLDESLGRVSIISMGSHLSSNKGSGKLKLPKNLMGLPFRIDYKLKVPRYCDLEVSGGDGSLSITAVEGAMRINYLKTDAKLEILTGSVVATFGSGTVNVFVPYKNWRARSADVQMATGDLNVYLPPTVNSEIDATILRTGHIENEFTTLKPRNRNIAFTDRAISGKAGNGGVPLRFTVGDGTLKILQSPKPE